MQATYPNTNGPYVDLVGLGQGIALCRGDLGTSAKPSEIFASKERHDAIFADDVPTRVLDIIFMHNAMKGLKRSLSLYLTKAIHADEDSQALLGRPVVRHTLFYLALMTLVQQEIDLREQFAVRLYKRASPILVDALQSVWRRNVAKVKQFCADEAAGGHGELSTRRLKVFADELALDRGLDPLGPLPFTGRAIRWGELDTTPLPY